MRRERRHLRNVNWARAIVATTLLVAAFTIDLLFAPLQPLDRLYLLAAVVYGAILLYALADRWLGDAPWFPAVQVAGDAFLVAGFVVATGGALSPVSFLFALPVMLAAALWGRRGGVVTAGAVWLLFGAVLVRGLYRLPAEELPPGRVLYAAVSHLLGFLLLGVLGGMLADRLRVAHHELDVQRGSLTALRARHAQIVESINTGLLTTDDRGAITFVNRAGSEILRQRADALAGRAVVELFGLPAEFLGSAHDACFSGKRYRFERAWLRPPSNEELLLGFAVAPLRAGEGMHDGWLITFQDLTEIASLEAQVRTRERMAALGEMAAGMAHELRNPLTAISGSVQILAPVAPAEQRNLVEIVLRETERLNRIIRDFLEFARPGPFRPRRVELVPLMEEMSRMFRKSPEFKPEHRIEVVAGGGNAAFADPDRIRQVFWNLAGNALKAMPNGGVLTIAIEGYDGDHVQLAFRDEGEGMDGETLARIFEPFHGRFKQGTGLGGAIVYRIAEEHGGRVQVVSRRGRGTEIRIILPVTGAEAAHEAASDALAEPDRVGAWG